MENGLSVESAGVSNGVDVSCKGFLHSHSGDCPSSLAVPAVSLSICETKASAHCGHFRGKSAALFADG